MHLIDLRNHGRSPHSLDFNYEVMSEDLYDYMEDHNIIKANILGHSLGGKSSYEVCFYPQRKSRKTFDC